MKYRSGRKQRHLPDEPHPFHTEYTVRDEKNQDVGINLLILYYGALWTKALDRLHHKIDGHLFSLRHQGQRYDVYRKVETRTAEKRLYLRLVSQP